MQKQFVLTLRSTLCSACITVPYANLYTIHRSRQYIYQLPILVQATTSCRHLIKQTLMCSNKLFRICWSRVTT